MSKINDILKTIILISIIMYTWPSVYSMLKKQWNYKLENHNKIGYIPIHENINNASYYRKQLADYFKDSSIKAILLNIESDGGALGSCQALAYDIDNLKRDYPKPIISYSEKICTSGAYQIASATDYIITTGSCIVGNIGKSTIPAQSMIDLIKNSHGELSNDTQNISERLTDEQKGMFQNLSDNIYQQVTKEIASKRHLQMHKIDQWGQGKLFTGQQAYDLKLIDAIGSKTTAVNLIKKNIIPSDRKIEWVIDCHKNLIENFFNFIDQKEDADLDTNF